MAFDPNEWEIVGETSMAPTASMPSFNASDWEIVDEPSVAPRSTQDLLGFEPGPKAAAAMTIGGLSKLLPFNFGDEIVAGGSAAIDALKGQDIGSAYDQRLNQIRDYQKAFSQENPASSVVLDVGSVLLMPFKSKVGTKTTVLGKTAQGAKEGATLGSLFGFGGGEGKEDRLSRGAEGATIGSVFSGTSGGATALAPMVKEGGKSLLRKSVGARSSDYSKSAKDIGIWDVVDDEVASKTKLAIDELQASGVLGNSTSASKMLTNLTKQKSEIGKQVGNLIDDYDKNVAAPVIPTFDRALNYIISGKAGNGAKTAERELYRLSDRLQKEGGGKLRFLQNEKSAWGGKYDQGNDSMNGFYRALYGDLKDAIEKAVPGVKPLNQELTKYNMIDPILRRNLGGEEASTWIGSVLQALRTSGGSVTTPVLIGAGVGGASGGLEGAMVGAALMSGSTPKGQQLVGKGMVSGANALRNAPQLAPVLNSVLQPNRDERSQEYSPRQELVPPVESVPSRPPAIPFAEAAPNPSETQQVFSQLGGDVRNPETPQEMGLLLKAIETVESGGNPKAVSHKGAVGTHQVMPIAMREVMRTRGIDDKQFTDADLRKLAMEPGVSEDFGTAYFQMMLDQFGGDAQLALAAYNGGPGRVASILKKTPNATTFDDIKHKLPAETAQYVPKIEKVFEKLLKG